MWLWLLALLAVLVAVVVLVLRRRFVVVRVAGPSMQPTLRDGQRVLVRRCALAQVRTGQVVVLRQPPSRRAPGDPPWLVKRAVAVPGDPVPVDRVPALAGGGDERVPAGHLVVLGDNRERSFDSRQVGYFGAEALLGVVLREMSG